MLKMSKERGKGPSGMLFCRFVCKYIYIYIFIYRFEKIKSVLFGFGVVSSAIQHTKKLFI